MTVDEPAVDIRGLVKRYGRRTAVAGLDLRIARGEVYGLLGPNGAGKTTTIRTVLGYLNPTEGRVTVLGGSAREPAVRRRVGYLPGDTVLERRMRVADLLRWYGDLRGGVPEDRVAGLCERLGLDRRRRAGDLSKGNRQKAAVVQAFMHAPDVLVLDEPTSGLDPLVQNEVLALVAESRAAGAAVLFSSHVLSEVEDVADRVGILREGLLVREAPLDDLRGATRQRIELRFPRDVPDGLADGLDGVTVVERTGGRLVVDVDGPLAPLLARAAEAGVVRLVTHRQDLEDVFLEYYRGVPRQGPADGPMQRGSTRGPATTPGGAR